MVILMDVLVHVVMTTKVGNYKFPSPSQPELEEVTQLRYCGKDKDSLKKRDLKTLPSDTICIWHVPNSQEFVSF